MPNPTHTDATRIAKTVECTAQLRTGAFCSNFAIPTAPFPICVKHAAKLYRFIRETMADVDQDKMAIEILATILTPAPPIWRKTVRAEHPKVVRAEHPKVNPDMKARLNEQSVVYYVRIHDYIKIGTTTNLTQRLGTLRVNESEVLATEPGNKGLENIRLKQFAKFRIGRRENFVPAKKLLAHIDEVLRINGAPTITGYLPAA